MNDTVIVTVSGDRAEEALEADRLQPVGRLLAGWAPRCSSLPATGLAVVTDDGSRLDPEVTLAALGASYGTTLRLVPTSQEHKARHETQPTEPPVVDEQLPPLPQTPPPQRLEEPAGPAAINGHDGSRGDALEVRELTLAPAVGEGNGASSAACNGTSPPDAVAYHQQSSPPTAPVAGDEPGGLPRRVGGVQRRVTAARAALSRQPLPALEDYAVAERPGPLSRWRRSMAATDHLAVLEQRVRQAVIGESVLIAVVSPKGGVGKTTLTGLLGSLLAELRRDPVMALDANADYGNLAARLCAPEARGATVAELWAWAEGRSVTPAALAQRLGQGPHGLRVVGTPAEAEAMLAAADHGLYQEVLAWLRSFGGVVLADCGTGLLDPPTRAALEGADQIVLVTDSAADTARLVVKAGRQLPPGRPCWLVANKVPPRGARVDLDALRCDLPEVAGSVVLPAVDLAENVLTAQFRWEAAPRAWRAPLRELATLLSAGWTGR